MNVRTVALAVLFAVPAAAAAQNLLENPNFDDGLEAWDGKVTYAPFEDTGDCAGSGAAEMALLCIGGGGGQFIFEASIFSEPCVVLPPGVDSLQAVVHARWPLGDAGLGFLRFNFNAWDSASCVGPNKTGGAEAQPGLDESWSRADFDVEFPAGTQAVLLWVQYELTADVSCDTFPQLPPVWVDTVYLGVGEPILAHGFESAETCPFTPAP